MSSLVQVVLFAMHDCDQGRSLLKNKYALYLCPRIYLQTCENYTKNDLLYNKIDCYNIAVQRRLNIKIALDFYLCPGIYLQACENDTKRSLIQ